MVRHATTYVTKARTTIGYENVEDAVKAVREVIIALDNAVQKGAVHKKNASCRKGRLMRQLAQLKTEQADG